MARTDTDGDALPEAAATSLHEACPFEPVCQKMCHSMRSTADPGRLAVAATWSRGAASLDVLSNVQVVRLVVLDAAQVATDAVGELDRGRHGRPLVSPKGPQRGGGAMLASQLESGEVAT